MSGLFILRCSVVALCVCGLQATPLPDLVVFDEDDPLGADFYDASVSVVRKGARLRLGGSEGDKLLINKGRAARNLESGKLAWFTGTGGEWDLFIFRPGFSFLRASGYAHLELSLNGPEAIPAAALPVVTFENAANARSGSVALADFLARGLDGDASTWQRVSMPLSNFAKATFTFELVKAVALSQAGDDDQEREIWLDDIRLVATERLAPTRPPAAPVGLAGRTGDRSVTLHWENTVEPFLDGFHVFRSTAPTGSFEQVTQLPLRIRSFADVTVENNRDYYYQVRALNEAGLSMASEVIALKPIAFEDDDDFLEYVQATAFDYFWYEADPAKGLVRDRSEPFSPASIAATGFGLTAWGIGIDHGWVSREAGRERTLRLLDTLLDLPQGASPSGTAGHRGWFYHFLEMDSGTRAGDCELSSIDTGLLMMGVLYAREYFDQPHPDERRIRSQAEALFGRVDWRWMLNGDTTLSLGWFPERGFITHRWKGYNEASLLYLLGLGGTESEALSTESWVAWTKGYRWEQHHGYQFVSFPPLFGHQYTACWIDLRYIQDDYMRRRGITYFENSRRATLAQRAYCEANPRGFRGYGTNLWGLTACDGPGTRGFFGYRARGAPPPENDDGTLAPTAAGGSVVFAPEYVVPLLRHMYEAYRTNIWCGYGFRDAFNLEANWWGPDVVGIDQGPILLMIENLRHRSVWNQIKKSPFLQHGLRRAGFRERVAGRERSP